MKLFKYSLLLLVGISFASPKVFADNLDNVPLAKLRELKNMENPDAVKKYYAITRNKYENKSLSELEVMANRGDSEAAARLGGAYSLGLDGATIDPHKALQWYQKAVKEGDVQSLEGVAQIYLDGQGVPQDVNKAITLYEQAANQGVLNAYNLLGLIYLEDKYGVQDFFKAKECFEKSAKLGSGFALFNLGSMYQNGLGTVQDKEKAKEYYKQACLKKEQAGCFGYKQLNDQ